MRVPFFFTLLPSWLALANAFTVAPPRFGAPIRSTRSIGSEATMKTFLPSISSSQRWMTKKNCDHKGGDEPHEPQVPEPGAWDDKELDDLLDEFRSLLTNEDGTMSAAGAAFLAALSEVCNPVLTPPDRGSEFWLPFRNGEKDLADDFFKIWCTYAPAPEDPSLYIEFWDYLVNTNEGKKYTSADSRFRKWFVRFLDLRGKWINSKESTSTMEKWMTFKGTTEHPFDMNNFVKLDTDPNCLDGGFETFNQFFLRRIKPSVRPLDAEAKIVAPCDGGAFYIFEESSNVTSHKDFTLEAKSKDTFHLGDALPGYGNSFIGGPLIDILLWFTDYHHFNAPVDGTVLHAGEYQGSYNYDFDNYNPDDPYAPKPPTADSDKVGWYQNLNKHKRYAFIIKTKDMGLVAMIAIGFFGVGSIISEVKEGQELKKGEYMGHFGYGGSSILLAFEPNQDLKFLEDMSNANYPKLIEVQQGLGTKQEKSEKYYTP
mmetsp:Transcript_24794/g.44904  ORF Transcript_24794/g.44904 Transcript_24794/m.44904 type:complete len:484 (-) Transcript_24794:282-1733(-)|eukprot:CAMPEP_0198297316 /NCGR_PEP_ID=MMETSP1449-20131203/36457_1 /TAXON_ID=420275 /ORGANISM="Attheya septentrionalis, Strain CCMP2084" /LENGTH=483 /DNA_ID=CAMNT_0043998211 /DNA_START=64 /DNA_END=1515 /DNA_ORIENTATION=+